MSAKSMDPAVSERIATLRFPLMVLIVVIHVPWLDRFVADPSLGTFIAQFCNDGLVRTSIPTLTCISAYLIFRSGLDRQFGLLIRKRTRALLLPMILWNLPLVVALFVVQAGGWTDYEFNDSARMYPFDLMQWLNGVFAITQFPIVGPMHFLRDLYLVSFLAPLIGWTVRRAPISGLIVLAVVFYPGLDGPLFRNNSIPVAFYVGAMAAIQSWDLKRLDPWALPIAGLLVAICAAVVVFDLALPRPAWLWAIAPFLTWPAASLLVGTRAGRWFARQGQAAVWLFLFHGLVLIFVLAVFRDYAQGAYGFWGWLAGPLLITLASQLSFRLLLQHAPSLLALLIGGRNPRTAVAKPEPDVQGQETGVSNPSSSVTSESR